MYSRRNKGYYIIIVLIYGVIALYQNMVKISPTEEITYICLSDFVCCLIDSVCKIVVVSLRRFQCRPCYYLYLNIILQFVEKKLFLWRLIRQKCHNCDNIYSTLDNNYCFTYSTGYKMNSFICISWHIWIHGWRII